ncbi:MAG TPA: hypothetical protein VF240_16070 [Pyrinomonadaceae bacterium]
MHTSEEWVKAAHFSQVQHQRYNPIHESGTGTEMILRFLKYSLITLLLCLAYDLTNPCVGQAKHNNKRHAPTTALQNPPVGQGINAPKPPVKKKTLLTTLRLKGLSDAELIKLVTEQGVEFYLTGEDEHELRSAGASAALIDAVRKNVKTDIDGAGRIRILADSSLSNYFAYRRGHRFYVVMPGKNFSNLESTVSSSPELGAIEMQWLQLDTDTVFSLALPQGVMARVEQSGEQLDVILVRRISK